MKLIILAAGQGTRLRPLTLEKPKCMVEYKNKAIIDYIIQTAKACMLNDIVVVNGYKKDVLEAYLDGQDVKFCTNKDYNQTNMVSTLFCAEEFMNDDIIISYSDIVYNQSVLKKLMESDADIGVIVDKEWKKLWSLRMENPLDDAETLKVEDNKIIEIGKTTNTYDDIQGQYIGLIKISKEVLPQVIDYYNSLDQSKLYDGKDYSNMYMTSFIQSIIDNLCNVSPIFINSGWIEVDSIDDLNAYEEYSIDPKHPI